jgi:hypothetical protein
MEVLRRLRATTKISRIFRASVGGALGPSRPTAAKAFFKAVVAAFPRRAP